MTDMLYAKEGPDGYMLVSLQGPRDAVRSGEGDQSAVHVRLMRKADFEALLPPAVRPKPLPVNPHPPIPHMRMVVRDYPSAALRNGWEGTVSYQASIDAEGAVLNCQITESSGYPLLDRSTCQYVMRWHFLPATDAKGTKISGIWTSRETYTAPK
jgi:TonB family protein